LLDMFRGGAESHFNAGHALALVMLLAGVIAGVIAITQAQRKVPVQYANAPSVAKSIRRHLLHALAVNYAGVMPIIFAQPF